MSKLPVVSGDDVIKVLLKIGYEIVRQKGSHMRLRNKTRFIKENFKRCKFEC